MPLFYRFKYLHGGTSLVVQRLRLHLPMQEVWVRSLVGNLDPTWFMAKITKHKTGNIVINSIKILKMVHIKNNLKKKKELSWGSLSHFGLAPSAPPTPASCSFPSSANRLLLQPFALYAPMTWNTLFPVLSIPPLLKFQLRHQRELPWPLSAMTPPLRSSSTCPVSDGLLYLLPAHSWQQGLGSVHHYTQHCDGAQYPPWREERNLNSSSKVFSVLRTYIA